MADPDRFGPSWEDFKSWAIASDLEAYWENGQGEFSGTWLLRVKSAVPGPQA